MSTPIQISSEYISVIEFCSIYKYERQSVYNMINTGRFKLNYHYFKPSSRKVLFSKQKIEEWLQSQSPCVSSTERLKPSTVRSSLKKAHFSNDINLPT